MNIKYTDNSGQIREAFDRAVTKALTTCGLKGEAYAKALSPIDTGRLRNSITFRVAGNQMFLGTNTEYAVYAELGTGIYCTTGGGTRGWWVYVKGSTSKTKKSTKTYTEKQAKRIVAIMRKKGLDAYCSQGTKPHPFIKPAIADHKDVYKATIDDVMRNG